MLNSFQRNDVQGGPVPPRPSLSPASQGDSQTDMFDAIGLAAITVQSDGHILQTNRAGDIVLRRGDGLTAKKSVLGCAQPEDTKRILDTVEAAIRTGLPGAMVLNRAASDRPYYITVAAHTKAGTALVVFSDPDIRDLSLAERLRALFGLTAAEVETAIAVSEGNSLQDIAAKRLVRGSTVRSQMRSITAKMHCRRQAEVAAIIARLPPLFGKSQT